MNGENAPGMSPEEGTPGAFRVPEILCTVCGMGKSQRVERALRIALGGQFGTVVNEDTAVSLVVALRPSEEDLDAVEMAVTAAAKPRADRMVDSVGDDPIKRAEWGLHMDELTESELRIIARVRKVMWKIRGMTIDERLAEESLLGVAPEDPTQPGG